MRKYKNILSFVILVAVILGACTDDSLDPLQFNKVKKGTILALRGKQLENIYVNAKPGAEFFPRAIKGNEKFEFDAEYLSEDPSTLSSFKIYAVKKTKVGSTTTRTRVFLKEVNGSEFKTTSDYLRPWVSVSIPLTNILTAIGLNAANPADIETLVSLYATGIPIESDLLLKDGSSVLAANMVAAGLFASDQFYPAQVLTYSVTDICPYEASTWSGSFAALEQYTGGNYGPYNVNFVQDTSNPNKFTFNNFWDIGVTAYVVFDPETQDVVFPDQPGEPGKNITGEGTYDQCLKKFVITTHYDGSDFKYEFKKN